VSISARAAVAGPSLEELLKKADAHYSRRIDPRETDQAFAVLKQADLAYPGTSSVLWRLARISHWKATRFPKNDKKNRLEWFEVGKAYAERATQANPNDADAFYWLAALIGEIGSARGILQSLFMVGPMKQALDQALAIDPNHASAHYVMSELYRQVPGPPISIGNRQKAVAEARLAVKLAPGDSSHQLSLARALVAVREYSEARQVFNHILTMPLDPEDPEGTKEDQEAARQELAAIAGK
jgi:tetratricopeptide (TPR) repeat protein